MSVHQTKDGRWFVVWYESGKQRRRVLGRGEAARVLAQQLDTQRRIERAPKAVTVTVGEICQAYHLRHQRAASTDAGDFYRFSVNLLPTLGSIGAEQLTTRHLDDYVATRLSQGVVHTSIKRELTLLKAALNWASRQQPPIIVRNPVDRYRFKVQTGNESIVPPTPQEIALILEHSPPHLQRAIYLAWFCGCRPGRELLGITWGDVDLDRREIRIKSARKGAALVRYVPIHQRLLAQISAWKIEDGEHPSTALIRYRGKAIANNIHSAWNSAKRAAGITRRLRFYDLRHAFATYSLRAGADLGAVSRIMGHAAPTQTLNTYQHVLRDAHREAVETIPSLDNADNASPKLSIVK